jgi:spermidine synthase
MQLSKITQNGRLLYFNQSIDSISIYENDHYRWLMFDEVFQSVMLKRQTGKLILPHQYILMLPLVFFNPKNICEFGLGGGNLGRFLTSLSPTIQFTSVEKNAQVISCFNEYFNPNTAVKNLINNDAESALFERRLRLADWYIYDIYQHNNEATNAQLLKSKLLSKAIKADTWLSLNLPDPTEPELNYLLQQLYGVFPAHKMVLFKVPNFLNVIIHLVPKNLFVDGQLQRCSQSYLPAHLLARGFNYWSTLNIST